MRSAKKNSSKVEQDSSINYGMRPQENMAMVVWRRFRRHPGAIAGTFILSLIILCIILVSFSPYDPERSNFENRFQPPSWKHPFGTDSLGRDLLTRVLYGGRISLSVGLMAASVAVLIGVPIGAISGFYGGLVDNFLMRITDSALAFPKLLVLILLSALLTEVDLPFIQRNNAVSIALVIGVLAWMTLARIVRATFLALREMEYVTAARSIGASTPRLMLVEMLPNSIGPIIVEGTLEIAWAIMRESGLSFLGFGIMPPTPSWGNLLSNAQEHMTSYPWLAIFPGVMIFLTLISVNYIGDGLRDAVDPYKFLGIKY